MLFGLFLPVASLKRRLLKLSLLTCFKIEMHTVLTRFRIMVLDGGEIKEFNTPQALLSDHQSLFYSLAKEANIIANTRNND